MTSSSLLRTTANLLRSKSNWISNQTEKRDFRGKMALDRRGNECRYDDPNACKFSLDGALLKCADLSTAEGQGDYHQAAQYLRSTAKWKSIAEINDSRSHAEIVAMLERAAEAMNVEGRLEAA
jgi:hypothetical protein